MKSTTRSGRPPSRAGVEITDTDLFLVVLEPAGDGLNKVTGRHLVWRQEADSLFTEEGQRELTAALASLAHEAHLGGAAVHAILNSDFCVTRIFSGEREQVREEIAAVQERSRLYLSLGPGPKTHALMERSLDTKRQQAWVSVAHQHVVAAVAQAAREAGIHLRSLHHSLCAMAHAVGHTGRDAQRPVILIEADHRSVELGISFQGQLLLDYRPVGGHAVKDEVVQILARHLKRLQRYCARLLRSESIPIDEVILFGPDEDLLNLNRQFPGRGPLRPVIAAVHELQANWEIAAEFPKDSRFVPALGALWAVEAACPVGPDLLAEERSRARQPIVPLLVRTFWPAAAVVVLALGIWGAALVQNRQCAGLESQCEVYRPGQLRVAQLRVESARLEAQRHHLRAIQAQVARPAWHELIVRIGACLPQGVWLEQLRADETGSVVLVGPSHSEDGIYEFVRYLKSVPELSHVALESTQPVQLQSGPATLFGVKCILARPGGRKKEELSRHG